MTPIRVLHVIGGLNAGGMESMIMNYYRNINRDKVQFDFLVFSPKSFFDDEVLRLGGNIYRITPRRKNFFKNIKEIDDFFKNHTEYKIVHIHQGAFNLTQLRKAAKYNVPIRIAHSHGINIKYLKELKWYIKFYLKPHVSKLATHYFVCSPDIANHIFSDTIVNDKKYVYMKNAIDLERFSYNLNTRNDIRSKLNIENKFVIGHIGAFLPVKNHEFILDVFLNVKKSRKDAILLLIGGGELEEKIKDKANQIGVKESVIFLGVRSDTNILLQAMDAFIFPSIFEGLPVAMLEAQASGLNCFASSNISRDVDISGLVKFVSLKESPLFWANKILETRYNRPNNTKVLYKTEFNIKNQALWLEEFYLNVVKTT